MKLTSDEVKKVAKLASLPLSSDEEETYSEQLSKVFGYIEQLNKIDTKNVDATYNVSPNRNALQEDLIKKSLTQEEALANTENKVDGFFATKGIFEEGETIFEA